MAEPLTPEGRVAAFVAAYDDVPIDAVNNLHSVGPVNGQTRTLTLTDLRALLATVDDERAARERAEQQLAAVTQRVGNAWDRWNNSATVGDELAAWREMQSAVRALLDVPTTEPHQWSEAAVRHGLAPTTDTPCPTCDDTRWIPHATAGCEPCPDCSDTPEGP